LFFFYITASIFSYYNDISLNSQIIGSILLISFFGIPHGAIDNVILLNESKISSFRFYLFYIATIITYLIIWYFLPVFSFFLFLIISAYHFGESQLANYKIQISFKKNLYLLWGIVLMSTLIFYNANELNNLFSTFDDTAQFNTVFKFDLITIFFYSSNVLLLIFYIVLFFKNFIKVSTIKSEVFQLALIHITFVLFPIIVSFTLYFIFLHSIKVLTQEFAYLNKELGKISISEFIKMLAPHTIISFVFIGLFFYLSELQVLEISALLFSIVSLSVITLPHAFVMSRFYKNF
jgi:Brp/Blh family beta-carotene 15,15'-monooxygenase